MIGFDRIKVSAISFKPTKWGKEANADAMEAFFVEAAKETPQVILITEGALEGYMVSDIYEGHIPVEEMLTVSEPVDGPYIRCF